MPSFSNGDPTDPPRVSILREGPYLIASVHTALEDAHLSRLQHDLIERLRRDRARGVIIDVAAMDVVDSFSSRTLRNLAAMAQLRGAQTVIVGISPELAFTMVRLSMTLQPVHTALDLDEGIALLDQLTGRRGGIDSSTRRGRS
jgi:rsbT antagonist protein RsbS